jgi:hypothetical protein
MKLAMLVLLILVTQLPMHAQGYHIDWYSINSGGGAVSGTGYRLEGTVGQPAVGFVKSQSFLHWIGFWSADVPNPTVVSRVDAAKLLPDGTFVSVAGKIATSGATDFEGFFYIEESGRHSGIRVIVPTWPVDGLVEGSVVNVIGTLGTGPNDERQISAPYVIVISSTQPLRPLGMNNRSVGGGRLGAPPLGQYGVAGGVGLNSIGLLIETWGRVVSTGPGYAIIDDGSGKNIKIDTSLLVQPPAGQAYISVVGISSLEPGRLPLVLPRRNSDVTTQQWP